MVTVLDGTVINGLLLDKVLLILLLTQKMVITGQVLVLVHLIFPDTQLNGMVLFGLLLVKQLILLLTLLMELIGLV